MATKHHAKRIRKLHTRYCLITLNAVALAGLLSYGIAVRGAEAVTAPSIDTAVLHAMMDADTTMAPSLLMPPEVK